LLLDVSRRAGGVHSFAMAGPNVPQLTVPVVAGAVVIL